jgi:chemotaxis signal transduction protein
MTGRILIAEVGGERISLLLEQVAEVLEHTSSFPLPLAPLFLDRAISSKGCLTPVLDTARFLGWGTTRSPGRILVMVGDGVNLALHVDRVTDIVSADTVLGEKPSVGEPFASLLVLPCGEVPLLSSGQLLRMLERTLAGSRGETGHENTAG